MFDFSPSLAEALSGDCTRPEGFRGLAEEIASRAIVPSFARRRQEIQLLLPFGAPLPNAVKPERRAWARQADRRTLIAKRVRVSKHGKVYRETRKPNDHAMSYSEVGKALGVSYQRIRQIEARALEKCRKACEELGITPEDFIDGWSK